MMQSDIPSGPAAAVTAAKRKALIAEVQSYIDYIAARAPNDRLAELRDRLAAEVSPTISKLPDRPATYTCEVSEIAGPLYYFKLADRVVMPPYTTQRHVEAILDIASDGTLAGVELISDMPPPPPTYKLVEKSE